MTSSTRCTLNGIATAASLACKAHMKFSKQLSHVKEMMSFYENDCRSIDFSKVDSDVYIHQLPVAAVPGQSTVHPFAHCAHPAVPVVENKTEG
jgi:hypothetical protein